MCAWRSQYTPNNEDLVGMQREQLRDVRNDRNDGELSLPSNKSSAGFADIYIMADTRYRRFGSRLRDDGVTFDLANLRSRDQDGQIRTMLPTVQIVEMEIMHSFLIPKLRGAFDHLLEEVTIEVREIGTQAFHDGNGNKHHFSMITTAATNANYMRAMPAYHSGDRACKFIFNNPITLDRALTLRFRTPTVVAPFYDDYMLVNIAYDDGDKRLVLTPTPSANGAGADGHQLTSADCFAFQDYIIPGSTLYDSTNPVSAFYKETFYAPEITGETFTCALPDVVYDAVSVLADKPTRASVYIGTRRMRIPIRMRTVTPYATNYGVAVL